MAQLVSLQQAACNALAAWLTSELTGQSIVIEPRWISSDRQLPPKAISVIEVGEPDIDWLDPEVLSTTNVDLENSTPVKKVDTVWTVGNADQALQLDVWALTDVELDDIRARLFGALNAGDRGLGLTRVDPFAVGLQLPLADGWDPGIATYVFQLPDIQQSPSAVAESEWRATYRGRVSMQLAQRARTARIARVLIKTRVYQSDPVDPADPPQVTIVTVTDT